MLSREAASGIPHDCGLQILIDILKSLGPIDCRIREITDYTAVLDAKLNEIIKFEDKPISQLIAETSRDGMILASYSLNPEKFHAYCWLVTKHINDKPIIEIEFLSKISYIAQ